MKSFLSRFGALITFVLSGFDRLRFCGESRRLSSARGVDSYLYQHRIRYTDFPDHAQNLTKTLCQQTELLAKEQDVPLHHVNSPKIDKEALELAQRDQRTSGRVALLTCVECCSTYRLRKNNIGYIKPVKEQGQCLHYYHYFLHADFLFRRPADLAKWYARWIKYGIETLQCRDVLRYLGKEVTRHGYVRDGGEVKIDLRQRPEGTRLKF